MMAVNFAGMSQADIEALIRQQYGNIGTPTANSDNRYGANGQGNGYYSGGGLDFLSPTAGGGYTGPIGAPYDQPGQGGMYGQQFGTWGADGSLTGSNWQQTQRPTFLDQNGWIAPLMPVAAWGAGQALGAAGGGSGGSAGGFSGAASGSGAAGQGIADSVAPGWVSGESLPAGSMWGGEAAGAASGASSPLVRLPAGADVVGSDWAAGAATGPTAGLGGAASSSVPFMTADSARLLAGAAGAAAGATGSGQNAATTSRNVPEWAQPYSQDIVQRGQAIANTPFQQFGGQRFAGPNDAQRNAWEMVNQAANSQTAQQGQAASAYQSLLSGNTPNFANGARVDNQYIGQATPGASNQYIGQQTNSNVSALANQTNPYLGQQTQQIGPLGQMSLAQTTTDVGKNALLGQNNPYLQDAIGYATGDITRNFQNTINPQLDRMARASGSFGNSGVEQARQEAERTMAQQIGRTTSDMRMADYNLQAQLGEGDLARRTNAALTDASRNLGASQTQQQFNLGQDFQRQALNSGYQAADLSRNLAGANQQQANQLNAGMFDTTQRANDLSRNAQLTQNLGQFNSSLAQSDLGRNASLTGQQQQFNANQGNFDITNGLNAWNSAQNRAASTLPQWQAFAEQPYRAANALGIAGQQMNQYAQHPLDFNFQEFMRQQGYPAQQLGVYQNAYNTGVNGQSVQSTPTGNSPAASILGGAASGLGLYNLFTNQRY